MPSPVQQLRQRIEALEARVASQDVVIEAMIRLLPIAAITRHDIETAKAKVAAEAASNG